MLLVFPLRHFDGRRIEWADQVADENQVLAEKGTTSSLGRSCLWAFAPSCVLSALLLIAARSKLPSGGCRGRLLVGGAGLACWIEVTRRRMRSR